MPTHSASKLDALHMPRESQPPAPPSAVVEWRIQPDGNVRTPLPNMSATRDFPKRETIESRQLQKINSLLKSIIPANAFYTAKLKASDFKEGFSSLERFSGNVPFTVRH